MLKSEGVIALDSVRSRRLFCERLATDRLFRWFWDVGVDAPGVEPSTFSQNSERLLAHATARKCFEAVVGPARPGAVVG
ncbi:MAG TPA: transposase [Nitrospira sp.]|nr:transposase [Nitrospira sp.]